MLIKKAILVSGKRVSYFETESASFQYPIVKTFFQNQEIDRNRSVRPILPEEVARGSMPTVCLRQIKDPVIWFRGYEQTYLERDVRELSQVGDLIALRTLLRLASLRTGQLLSPSQVARKRLFRFEGIFSCYQPLQSGCSLPQRKRCSKTRLKTLGAADQPDIIVKFGNSQLEISGMYSGFKVHPR